MSKIIALVDGSVYSQSVCDHAAWVARRKKCQVEILHILDHKAAAQTDMSGNIGLGARSKLMEELADKDAKTAKLAQKRGRAILDEAKQRIQDAGIADVTMSFRNGDLLEELLRAEDAADLVIIGRRGETTGTDKLHMGGNLERVVRSCRKPVLVTAQAFKPIESFIVAFDGGSSSAKAVDHVAQSNVFAGLTCHLLTVGTGKPAVESKLEAAAKQLEAAGFTVKKCIAQGQAEDVIAAKIEKKSIDLLAMGAYGHSHIRNLFKGSITTTMVQSSKIPVLLFR